MKLSNIYQQQILLLFKCSLVLSLHYNTGNFRPIEYLDFELINGDKSSDLSRNRYELTDNLGIQPSSNLPLLSRGVREIEDLEETFEDSVSEPTCSELRKMWRIARRLHKHAIQTNEIPQKLHPFSSFESDRFRAHRRFKPKVQSHRRMKGYRQSEKTDSNPNKEVASVTDYGTIRYAPSDPVKRPRNRGVYDVLQELNPGQTYSKAKNPGAWNTGIIEFEPAKEKTRPFDKLRNELRKDKNQGPMPDKNLSKSKMIWGKALTHYKHDKNKGGKSKVEIVRQELLDKARKSRDLSRGSEGPAGLGSNTSFGQQLGRKKSFRVHSRSQRKKVSILKSVFLSLSFIVDHWVQCWGASVPLTLITIFLQMRDLQKQLLTELNSQTRQDKVQNTQKVCFLWFFNFTFFLFLFNFFYCIFFFR